MKKAKWHVACRISKVFKLSNVNFDIFIISGRAQFETFQGATAFEFDSASKL